MSMNSLTNLKKLTRYQILDNNNPSSHKRWIKMKNQEILAIIRTLLALERNYLAVERTQLAELRTGLTLAIIAPPAAAAFAYTFNFLPDPMFTGPAIFILLSIVTIYGIIMAYQAYRGLRDVRKIQNKIRSRETELISQSDDLYPLLEDILAMKYKLNF
jgi:uncharacterized membrane protein YidH (DUF202 family)